MLFSRLLHAIPSQCAVCRGWGPQAICPNCITQFAAIASRCRQCALRVPPGVDVCGACLVDPPAFDGALAGVDYAHPWSNLIAQFKFRGGLDLADAMTAPLAAAWVSSARIAPDLLLPAPLSLERLRSRGFNQAWELARRLAATLGLRADPQLLLRVRDSPHQLALPPDERAANVQGVFAVEPLRRSEVAGRSIAVVDDVMTTGATLGEIARVLKQAGASRVEAWTLARTPREAA